MANCIILGTETKSRTKGFPLSREAREKLGDLRDLYNGEIADEFVKLYNERNGEDSETMLGEKTLRRLAPKISKNEVLRLVNTNHPVMLRVLGDALSGKEDE